MEGKYATIYLALIPVEYDWEILRYRKNDTIKLAVLPLAYLEVERLSTLRIDLPHLRSPRSSIRASYCTLARGLILPYPLARVHN